MGNVRINLIIKEVTPNNAQSVINAAKTKANSIAGVTIENIEYMHNEK